MANTSWIIAETGGMEFEVDNIAVNRYSDALHQYFSIQNDASIETREVPTFKGIPIKTLKKYTKFFDLSTLGAEFVSNRPLPVGNSFEIFDLLISNLKRMSVEGRSKRSGVHFHITLSPGYRIMQEIFNLGLHLESVFYYLGGMGYEYRGLSNNNSYCFPLSSPPIVKGPRNFVPLFIPEDIFGAKDFLDILRRSGDLSTDCYRIYGRYAPIRYSGINFYSMFIRGSLEFRMFNTTICPFILNSVFEFCSSFVKSVLSRSFSGKLVRLEPNELGNVSKEDTLKIAEKYMSSIDFKYTDIILEVINSTPTILYEPSKVFSHIMYHPRNGDQSKVHYKKRNIKDYVPKCIPLKEYEEILIPITEQHYNTKWIHELPDFMLFPKDIKSSDFSTESSTDINFVGGLPERIRNNIFADGNVAIGNGANNLNIRLREGNGNWIFDHIRNVEEIVEVNNDAPIVEHINNDFENEFEEDDGEEDEEDWD